MSDSCPKCHRHNTMLVNSAHIDDGVRKKYYYCTDCKHEWAKISDSTKHYIPPPEYKPDLWWEDLPRTSLDKCKSNTDFWHENPNDIETNDFADHINWGDEWD